MPKELGIKVGEIWAYKLRLSGPLVSARVLNPGRHFDAHIELIILDGPTIGQRVQTRRNRLPCKWDDREAWLSTRPDFRRELPPEVEVVDPFELPADQLFSMGENALRRIMREELEAILSRPPQIAYNYKQAAIAVGLSASSLKNAVRNYDLTPSYYGSKPVFTPDELARWVATFPDHN